MDLAARTNRVVFTAQVEGYEPEMGTASNGSDYVCLRDATVTTEFETIQRTVMAFGQPAAHLARLLADSGEVAVTLELFQAGPILKVDGEEPIAA